jgi:hypothetical protein
LKTNARIFNIIIFDSAKWILAVIIFHGGVLPVRIP